MSKNTVWHHHAVTKTDRQKLNGHKSCILWFTGFSGSGKSTLAGAVEELLHQKGIRTYLLDGDNVRQGLCADLNFSDEDRTENIRRIGEVARLFVDAGAVVLTAFISPFRADRDRVRRLVAPGEFIEVFVKCPLSVCEARDVKGLYAKARRGDIPEFTGKDSAYEEPETPELVVETDQHDIAACVRQVVDFLEKKGYLS